MGAHQNNRSEHIFLNLRLEIFMILNMISIQLFGLTEIISQWTWQSSFSSMNCPWDCVMPELPIECSRTWLLEKGFQNASELRRWCCRLQEANCYPHRCWTTSTTHGFRVGRSSCLSQLALSWSEQAAALLGCWIEPSNPTWTHMSSPRTRRKRWRKRGFRHTCISENTADASASRSL